MQDLERSREPTSNQREPLAQTSPRNATPMMRVRVERVPNVGALDLSAPQYEK